MVFSPTCSVATTIDRTYLNHERYIELREQAYALSHCFRDIWQALAVCELLQTTMAATATVAGHAVVHRLLTDLHGLLQQLVAVVAANQAPRFIDATRPIMLLGASLMKMIATASEELGTGIVNDALTFFEEPRIKAARERLSESISELLSATKASVGVWPGPHASQVGIQSLRTPRRRPNFILSPSSPPFFFPSPLTLHYTLE